MSTTTVHAALYEGDDTTPCCRRTAAELPEADTFATEPEQVTCKIQRWRFTLDELHALARERFGDDPREWAFQCPNCGDIATPSDFLALNDAPDYTSRNSTPATADQCGFVCIGRVLGARKSNRPEHPDHTRAKRGCDWTAGGFLRGPWSIEMPDGRELLTFPLAPAPEQPQP